MKNRKVGSTELFRGGPYTDELGIADWTGSTLRITMRDQYGALVINSQLATAATGSTWTYQPLAGHVAVAGTFQIEITDTTKGIVYPQSGYEQLIIESILTSTGTPPVDPTNNSITLAMMQQQTPGAVLLYDASGNAIAYAPGVAGRVLTANGAGVPPTWQAASGGITQLTGDVTAGPGAGSVASTLANVPNGTPHAGSSLLTAIAAPGTPAAGKLSVYADATTARLSAKDPAGLVYEMPRINSGSLAGRAEDWVRIDTAALAGVTYTVNIAANAWQRLWFDLDCSLGGFTYIKFRANGDTGNNYDDNLGNLLNAAAAGDGSFGVQGFAKVGLGQNASQGHFDIHFNPRTTGRKRLGSSGPNLATTGVVGTSYVSFGGFSWNNLVNDVTSLTLFADFAMTGNVIVRGIPA